jgi:UDP-glucose 4-epimerase
VVNIGSGSGHSVVDLLGVVGETVGRSPITVFVPRRPHDVDAIVLDVSKIRSLVSYEPMTLVDGVRATWDARHPVRGVLDATSHL